MRRWSLVHTGPTHTDPAARSVLDNKPFSSLPVHGNAGWTPQRLALTALLMGWDDGQTLSTRFENARSFLKHHKAHWSLGGTYSGFAEALVRECSPMDRVLKERLQQALRQESGAFWIRNGWLACAVDGTRIEAPHTLDCEQGLGSPAATSPPPRSF